MGFLRFRRSLKIAPGIRMNVGKTGVSWSFGHRGAHVTLGKRGVRTTVGLPGTGLSYTAHTPSTAPTSRPGIDPARFHIEPALVNSTRPMMRGLLLTVGAMVLVVGIMEWPWL